MRRLGIVMTFVGLVAAAGCGDRADRTVSATDIITARTVGIAFLEENRLEEAEAEFLKLIDMAPREAVGYANLGLTYLRMGRFADAEEQLDEASRLDPNDAEILLLRAKVFRESNRPERAVEELQRALEGGPSNVKVLYELAELYAQADGDEARTLRTDYLGRIIDAAPANVTARLQLAELLVRRGVADSAAMQLEEVRRQMGELPVEAADFYQQALTLLRSSQTGEALSPTIVVHNFLKATPRYQAGLQELQGPAGAPIGMPVITFSQNIRAQAQEQEAILAALRFTDATDQSGLAALGLDGREVEPSSPAGTVASVGDFDADGDQDLFVSSVQPGQPRAAGRLLRNDFGEFIDVTDDAGLAVTAPVADAIFADYDNDGALDLFVTGTDGNILYHNEGGARFRDVTRAARIAGSGGGRATVLVDLDHDGDLDVFVARDGPNRVYRNNLDGTFVEMAADMQLAGSDASRDVVFGDFDDDGDTDLFVVNGSGTNRLYSNLRGGRFEDVTEAAGLVTTGGSGAAVVADYDNDGFLDLFVTGLEGGEHRLYHNHGAGTFEIDTRSPRLQQGLQGFVGLDAAFLDFDNDGFLDLAVSGRGSQTAGGVVLFRNDGSGVFADRSDLLPGEVASSRRVAVADYNEDGDIDLFASRLDGSVQLLRNDGGNANRYLNVQLVGLTAGSGKNNHFGIGAKLEVRAGDLYQVRVVTSPMNHFGLGSRLKADVVRIVWTNGVPQNIFFPGSDQDIVEEQILKGSCAFLYTWNGEEYVFVKDMIWKSALGMPLGIMGGGTAYAPAYPSREYLKIPGEVLQKRRGRYSMQITEELWETAYVDELRLLVVDHPESTEVYVDERFVPTSPDDTPLRLYTVYERRTPVAARDERGNDVLETIRHADDVYVSDFVPARYQGITKLHDLELDLGALNRADSVLVFLRGWVFPTDASINVALSQSDEIQVVGPVVQVLDGAGNWRTVIENMSFPTGKDKTVVLDLTEKFLSDDFRVRIRTNMEIYWDEVFFTTRHSTDPAPTVTLQPTSADLHYRGFSRVYRKGGRFGPHWFDYSEVTAEPKWRDLVGNYTRFGDVTPLVTAADDRYVIMNAGDEMTVEFDADAEPELPAGWKRDFLIYSVGWIKDGDLNTATGKTVEPLPFAGATTYPYGADESYPTDEVHQRYLRTYNTRYVKPNLRAPEP